MKAILIVQMKMSLLISPIQMTDCCLWDVYVTEMAFRSLNQTWTELVFKIPNAASAIRSTNNKRVYVLTLRNWANLQICNIESEIFVGDLGFEHRLLFYKHIGNVSISGKSERLK